MDEGLEFLPGLFLARRANYRFAFVAFVFAKIAFPLFRCRDRFPELPPRTRWSNGMLFGGVYASAFDPGCV